MDEQLKELLRDMIEAQEVFLFMKGTPQAPQCGFSANVVDILHKLDVKFGSFNILMDDRIRQGLKEYSNWPTFPQLYVKGKLIGGCDVIVALHEKGQLQKILQS